MMYIYIFVTCAGVYYNPKGVKKSKRYVNKKGIHFNVRSFYGNLNNNNIRSIKLKNTKSPITMKTMDIPCKI